MDRRRAMLAGAAALLGAIPAARAQGVKGLPRLGFMATAIAQGDLEKGAESPHPYVSAFVAGLQDYGWVDGRNLQILWRSAGGQNARHLANARELAGLPVDVIVAFGSGVTAAARETRSVPIVMGNQYNALRFAKSLARPGGNVTGLTGVLDQDEGTPKRVALLKAAAPGVRRIAWITQAGGELADRFVDAPRRHVEAAAELRVEVQMLTFGDPGTLEAVIDSAVRQGAQAIMLDDTPPLHLPEHQRAVAEHARRRRLPSMVCVLGAASQGALITYGPDVTATYRRLGYFVDRILKGVKPGDIPIEQPSKYELHINLTTAKDIGLKIAESLLLQADRVIQ